MTSPKNQSPSGRVLLSYTLLTLLMTWPVAGRLGSHIPGNAGDAWVHLWNFVWVRDALTSGAFSFHTTLIYYPEGVSLLNTNIAWLQFLFWLLWQPFVGITIAYTLMFLATLISNAFTTYLLAHDITQSTVAAFVAGLVVGFWPYSLSHHNHPNGILIAAIPLTLLFLRRTVQNGRWHDAIWTGICLAFIGLSRWQHLLMVAPLISLYTLWVGIRGQAQTPWRRQLQQLSGAAIIALLLMAPLLLPTLHNQLTTTYLPEQFTATQTNLLAYLLPNRYHPLWGEAIYPVYQANQLGVNLDFIPFLGYTVLLLALIATLWRWRQTWFWFGIAALYGLLALGPSLQIGGNTYHIPLPYTLIDGTFVARLLRHPDRFNYLLGLPFALLAAWGVVVLQQRFKQSANVVITLLALLILAEYVVDYATLPTAVPTWYTQLAQAPDDFAILSVPLNSRTADKAYMYYQLTHGKPLVGGHVSREPETALSFQKSTSLLRALVQNDRAVPTVVDMSHQLQQLANANIRYLILHKAFLAKEVEAGWHQWLGIRPYHEDEDLIVYDLTVLATTQTPLQTFTDLQLLQATISPAQANVGDWLTLDSRWQTTSQIDQNRELCLQLIDPTQSVRQAHCQLLSPTFSTNKWQADNIYKPPPYHFQISPYLATNTYHLTIQLADETYSVGTVAITGIERTFMLPTPTYTTTYQWDEAIHLLGYDLAQTPDTLDLTLYWQAQNRLETSYKLFVHLIDPTTNMLVAQVDTLPRNWSYPTTWWEANEVIDDTITLPLTDVPEGTYTLSVGFYDEATGERLNLQAPNGRLQAAPLTAVTK